MRKVILYIACSLDGMIARADGSVDWLDAFAADYGYRAFYDSIDALILGGRTYRQALGFEPWPYAGKRVYVLTRDPEAVTADAVARGIDVFPVAGDLERFVRALLDSDGGHVWLVGGGEVIRLMLAAGLVDEAVVTVVPVILGEGVPLVPQGSPETWLTLLSERAFPDGLVQLRYRVRDVR